jgi:hypothetical protein
MKGIAMTHAKSNHRCTSPDCAAAKDTANHRLFRLPGTKWRAALGALAAAPLRLHQYRNFHSEVVEDALRAFDHENCS